MLDLSSAGFTTLVEVVPPNGGDARPILGRLGALKGLPIDAFSVASNPVAMPRMSALALSALISRCTGVPAIMHCTTRDHNRLSAWSNLCGAKALGIDTVLVATGDYIALGERASTTTVRDVDVYDLVRMACEVGLQVGVVFDPGEGAVGMERQIGRLLRKVEVGAQFVVTQPVYDRLGAESLARHLALASIPAILGILPLRSSRHAMFLNERVVGITVPKPVRQRMQDAHEPVVEGVCNAIDMLRTARRLFSGACIMPPFGHYELATLILSAGGQIAPRARSGEAGSA